ncbi:MAG: hypothetical protein JO126_06695 [Alphaproteobacteria bacterium]|nr:hypothetical protein [Alphaproteobacteria bacterium]
MNETQDIASNQFAIISDISQKYFGGIKNKSGFEAYKCFRDFLVELIGDPKKLGLFHRDQYHFNLLGDFQFVDPAYVDNITLCLSIKMKTPDIYEETKNIIDKYVRPKPQNEGFNHLYQECGGFLALLLQHYEGTSARHALHAARQLTKYSESTIEKSYRRMKPLAERLQNELPPPIVLAALYWTLHIKAVDPNSLEPFTKKSDRSNSALRETISAYWRFTEKVARHCHAKVLRYIKQRPLNVISILATALNVNFPLSEKEMNQTNAFTVLIITVAALLIDIMPEELEAISKNANNV